MLVPRIFIERILLIMKKTIKRLFFPLATSVLLLSTPAMAKNIKNLSLVIDTDMATGMDIGNETYEVRTNTSGVSIDSVELYDIGDPDKKKNSKSSSDDDDDDDDDDQDYFSGEWNAKHEPTLKIVVETKDSDDRFKMTKSSDLKLTGTGDPVYDSVSSSGSKATVYVKLRSLRTGAGALNNAHFEENASDGLMLYFDETTDDMYYEVRLYRNNKAYGTYTTIRGEDSLDLTEIIHQSGTYTASVRVRNTATSKYSKWIKVEGSLQVTQEDIDESNRHEIINPSSDEASKTTTTSGRWMQNQRGWWWQEIDNSYPYNAWKEIDGGWYYFDAEGYIVYGWQEINGNKYYFDPEKGTMKKGWVEFTTNEWYYFDPSTGAMYTGWHIINDKYYYFANDTGKLYVNTYTPDGFKVDSDGVYTGEHKDNVYDKYTFTTQIDVYEVENVNYNATTYTMEATLSSQPMPGSVIASKGSDGEYTFYKVVASYPGKNIKTYSIYATPLTENDVAKFAMKK